jgi:uncharacterized protein
MPNYSTPGVYIEEIPLLPSSVAPVATAVPAFVGYTATGNPLGTALPVAKRITSLLEYQALFGGAPEETFTISVVGSTISPSYLTQQSGYLLYNSVRMYFNNGGGPCYIVSVGKYGVGFDKAHFTAGLKSLKGYDEPTLVCIPETISLPPIDYPATVIEMLGHCKAMKDRFAIIDTSFNSGDHAEIASWRTAISANQVDLQYGAAYLPRLRVALDFNVKGSSAVTGDLTTTMGDLLNDNPSRYRAILQAINEKVPHVLPPSGAMAGVYASVDRERGVWKAPANVGIASLIAPTVAISNAQQDEMNVDASGKSINAIRTFTGRGTLVWGARTLAGNDNEWRYISVRRFFIFVEESLEKAMAPVVFEPNTASTWARVKGTIEGFLTNLWRQGALAGSKPEQAFFVNIGLGVTMTPQDILEGRLIVDIGLAAVRPAEFIVMRFTHKLQEA